MRDGMARETGTDQPTIVRFPLERRERPSVELLIRIAPSRSLVDTLIAERGEEPHDVQAEFARAFGSLSRMLGSGCGRDEVVVRLRLLVDAHLAHAIDLCRAHQSTADRMVALEVQAAKADRVPLALRLALDAAQVEFRDRAIVARAAADAAMGAASALATYIREELGALPVSAAEPRQLVLFGRGAE
jgi:hypothetical protein